MGHASRNLLRFVGGERHCDLRAMGMASRANLHPVGLNHDNAVRLVGSADLLAMLLVVALLLGVLGCDDDH
jgi:hypothetical protein